MKKWEIVDWTVGLFEAYAKQHNVKRRPSYEEVGDAADVQITIGLIAGEIVFCGDTRRFVIGNDLSITREGRTYDAAGNPGDWTAMPIGPEITHDVKGFVTACKTLNALRKIYAS